MLCCDDKLSPLFGRRQCLLMMARVFTKVIGSSSFCTCQFFSVYLRAIHWINS